MTKAKRNIFVFWAMVVIALVSMQYGTLTARADEDEIRTKKLLAVSSPAEAEKSVETGDSILSQDMMMTAGTYHPEWMITTKEKGWVFLYEGGTDSDLALYKDSSMKEKYTPLVTENQKKIDEDEVDLKAYYLDKGSYYLYGTYVSKENYGGIQTIYGCYMPVSKVLKAGNAVLNTAKDKASITVKSSLPGKLTYSWVKGKKTTEEIGTAYQNKGTSKKISVKENGTYSIRVQSNNKQWKKYPVDIQVKVTGIQAKVTVGKASVNSATNISGRKISVRIKSVKGAAGYQVEYSKTKNFKSKKSISTKKKSCVIKGLKKGTTYYVRVRAYKLKAEGSKAYGAYSAVKKVTVRK